ncbi:hypothetical protein FHR83_006243 [Actinoplanes campanulatus]|uniref:Recombination endonuclease VII n=1 Tax=Actinoplanes campanulatus TaxID=113559 RepID=A0A7W5FHF3_9ACTN|nr:endonuclease domain-containing protein [Actinoplanes campanulatus]MBB3098544.1 hypothetical protein [Actinoplanes campanulatus]GGN35817.1 hypothetical protein GCM10010109_60150 [Actinoplanes campanulatus]GID39238.1 hypothetical protein Aca09nite_57440 [Actinoplanes campanulatus]
MRDLPDPRGRHHADAVRTAPAGRPRQDGRPTAEAARLVVDHCHLSGRVRGLVCNNCNGMIGLARDRPEILRAGADYLQGREPLIEE